MAKILHISAHYGGGVGTVIQAWMDKDQLNVHRLTHLNTGNSGEVFDTDMVKDADIVLCHTWNHPAMFEFLINTTLPPCRLVLWSHVSGLYPPYVHFNKLIEYADRFVFTSPVSYESKEIQQLPELLKNKLSTIWSTYGLESFDNVQRTTHDTFNIGITGTVDYGKLHPNFIDMCANASISAAKFIVCSTDSQEHLKARADALGVYNRFSFEGRVEQVRDYLCTFDVFGYPLQRTHYGSCEQALGEAMICGAVPVVLNNTTERYIVEHMKTGIVANTLDEYSEALEFLYNHRSDLQRMSDNAIQSAKKRYNVINTLDRWNRLFYELLKQNKKVHKWGTAPMPPHLVYITSMGSYGKPFLDYVFADTIGDSKLKRTSVEDIKELYRSNPMFASNRKGSVLQYLNYYPTNGYLKEWSKLVNE